MLTEDLKIKRVLRKVLPLLTQNQKNGCSNVRYNFKEHVLNGPQCTSNSEKGDGSGTTLTTRERYKHHANRKHEKPEWP